MSDLKICRICLRTEAKMYTFDKFRLKYFYEEIMALRVNDNDGLPQSFCYECATMLQKFHRFKEKCFRGMTSLKELQWDGPITYDAVYKADRKAKNLLSPLSLTSLSDKTKGICIKDISMYSVKEEKYNTEDYDFYYSDSKDNEDSKDMIIDEVKRESLILKCEEINMKQKDGKCQNEQKKNRKGFDISNWKIDTLTDEEALKEFRSRADDRKYIAAPFKCTDCLKGFSKKEMLDRHKKLRHYEGIGKFECWFCRMRYKWKCALRKHMLHHYQKFQCLRCNLVCMQENTAVLHEEGHSGALRRCDYCDQQFRHLSTYYTHMRTHRSDFLCNLCGASFVSEAGLNQHKKVKHVDDEIESPDDDEDVNTFCDRCNITFETRKAYEEHIFHSATHVTSDQKPIENVSEFRKVFSKTQKEKIITALRSIKMNEAAGFPNTIRKRRNKLNKRIHRKPMSCYQCGKHFETQAACLKHHIAEHPRTSFHPPNERYICEICGASLAPGSVAVHLNIHSRATVYTCDTCGRQFHSSVGLKRHLVTHTGEKKFMCTKCDKRFTQSNSLKLHFRTSHLKLPYPKRARSKKDNAKNPKEGEITVTEGESDQAPPEPQLPAPPMGIEPVPNAMPIPDENVQYIRL